MNNITPENPVPHIGVIGGGPATVFMLKHLLKAAEASPASINMEVTIFEKAAEIGLGMPYSPDMVDRVHRINILAEEVPALIDKFDDWLRRCDDDKLHKFGIPNRESVNEKTIYRRIAMGEYLKDQTRQIKERLAAKGMKVNEVTGTKVTDVVDDPVNASVTLKKDDGSEAKFDRVVIATGHVWPELDAPEQNYYRSPWPIKKILPEEGEQYNHPVGLLGASLSAFDCGISLAERHGTFTRDENGHCTGYVPAPGTENFKLVMHSRTGTLPHLRCDFEIPLQEMYRHISPLQMQGLVKENGGTLSLDGYFQQYCKPALIRALHRDKIDDVASAMADPNFKFPDFISTMNEKRFGKPAFEQLQADYAESRVSVDKQEPIYWKEVLDDLFYSLNFHVDKLSAEDVILLRKEILPFILNIVAYLPLESAEELIALQKAGKVELVTGDAKVLPASEPGRTAVRVTAADGTVKDESFELFVDATGQKPISLNQYPFKSLVEQGAVRIARAKFRSKDEGARQIALAPNIVQKEADGYYYVMGGIEIDPNYRIVNCDGVPNERIYDAGLQHTMGIRPYTQGVQYCEDRGRIIANELMHSLRQEGKIGGGDGFVGKLAVPNDPAALFPSAGRKVTTTSGVAAVK